MPAETQDNPMNRVKNSPAKSESLPLESAEQKRINDLEMQLLRVTDAMESLQRQLSQSTSVAPQAASAVGTQSSPVFMNDIEANRWRTQAREKAVQDKMKRTWQVRWDAEQRLLDGKHQFLCHYSAEPAMDVVVGCDHEDPMASQGICEVKFRQYYGITGFAAGSQLKLTPWKGSEAEMPERQLKRIRELRDNLNS